MNTTIISSFALACLLACVPALQSMSAVKSWFQNQTFSFTSQKLNPALGQELFDASKQWMNDHKDALVIGAMMCTPVILLSASFICKKLKAKPKARKTIERTDARKYNGTDTTMSQTKADDTVNNDNKNHASLSEQKNVEPSTENMPVIAEAPTPKQIVIRLFQETLAGKADRTVMLRQIINRCSSPALEKAFAKFMIEFRAYKNGQGAQHLEAARTIASTLIAPLLDQVQDLGNIIVPDEIKEWLNDGFYSK